MSVQFSEDFNCHKIAKESKLFNLATRLNYRVYGLRKEGNPLIEMESINFDTNTIPNRIQRVRRFLSANKIDINFEERDGDADNYDDKIYIGLRRDLRQHVILSSSILQTIIYTLEGRIELDKKYTIPGIPRFDNEENKE